MIWFKAIAPVRLKLLIAFGFLTALTFMVALSGAIGSGGNLFVIAIGLVATLGSAIFGAVIREAIAGPYVATVVRMEQLAAGDLTGPILFTEYQECVGRLTRAMFTFRDAALDQIAKTEAQKSIVTALSDGLSQLAAGDLTTVIAAEFPQDAIVLKDNFNRAMTNLQALVAGVTESAANVRTGSAEIAQASEDLAKRTEGNAASLEQTSAALVQIDTRLKATAKASGQTVARANQATATVSGGRSTAEEAVAAMGRVSDSAKGIDSVIEGLDKIAFQTRVLAMNAAVEAGRAGDAGRGFAVVADLVSALAMRAEEEAKRARDQLTVTQTDIVTAVQAVEKVDAALANISTDVGEVHNLLGTMADDATAQSTAITQITTAIGAMDHSTQQNAAMVEETSAAARNLTAEVASLAEQAAMFKTGQSAPVRRVEPARPAPTAARAKPAAAAAYRSPVKALPVAAAVAGGESDDWNDF